ncbi:class I SAM-dependent methyltransferase [Flaviaesturariibacter amylovorans]|uniref:Methyltransferase domain-containing protein n=1 Tax=Flaviaesturariibacter amylovorans TaxID=1084520 RepID=A0ABP8HU99_9BACT
MTHSNYIIAGGAEGKERLAVLGNVLNPGTLSLLQRLHPEPIGHFLDLGCGGGTVAIAVAQSELARNVTGADFDATVLELARQDAAEAGLTNIRFETADATALDLHQQFDVVYARFLLSHLTDPPDTLKRMARAARPGGLVLVEDIDFSGHYCAPASSAFTRYLELFVRAARNNGQDPDIGLRLFRLFHDAGLEDIGFSVTQPAFHEGPGKWMGYYTLDKISGAVLRQGLATQSELQATLDELKAFTADPNSIISLPRVFQVWGRKRKV